MCPPSPEPAAPPGEIPPGILAPPFLPPFGLGLLRRELVRACGFSTAREVLLRAAYAQGWSLAEAMEGPGADAGPMAATLLAWAWGPRGAEAGRGELLSPQGLLLRAPREALEHLEHLGPAQEPVCWTTCGLLSGFLSRALGRDLLVEETRCLAQGDPHCRLRGAPRGSWPPERQWGYPPFPASAPEPSGPREAPPAFLPSIQERLDGMVARSAPMRRLLALARRLARVNSTLLITGESGTGKERVARLVHRASLRSGAPFIAVNCGAIPEALLESEWFGHARGAFTGAAGERAGLFEAAHGGTLLLDEVGEIPPPLQVKLLRVLQEREVRRVGESFSRSVDVRIIAATNRDLARETAGGRFRRDLYYRLNVVELHVPPLRERREDILPLAQALLAESARRLGKPLPLLSPPALQRLLRHPWPGNVRELENAMERAVALELTDLEDLEILPDLEPPPAPGPQGLSLAEVEREHILAVLARNGGNQTRTALQLRIGTATLYRKLRAYGHLPRPSRAAGGP